MRTNIVAGLLLLALVGTARADDNVAGTYDVKFEEMASNCNPVPVSMGRGKVVIEVKKNSLTVNIDLIPIMVGVPAKGGKINANTKRPMASTVAGLLGKYSVAGRVENGLLQLVLVAEYTNAQTNKPYCTQSWNVSGVPSTEKKSALQGDLFPELFR